MTTETASHTSSGSSSSSVGSTSLLSPDTTVVIDALTSPSPSLLDVRPSELPEGTLLGGSAICSGGSSVIDNTEAELTLDSPDRSDELGS